MKSWRKYLTGVALTGATISAGVFGFNTFQNVQFAHAEQQVESTRQQLSTLNDLATAFRNVGKVVEPSVVSISVTKTIKSPAHEMPFNDNFFRRFFPDQNGDGEPDLPPGFQIPDGSDGGSYEQIGTGSGVIMEVDGSTAYILTNNHVAGGASEMLVKLSDGREIKNATLVGADPKTDLAVVKIQADRLIPAKWGNSDELDKGDWVLAFGSPFGYIGSMTHGIVSAVNRTNVGIINQGYEDFIQVDAPINPGNSGGPLVNMRGEVVGINTAIASRTGGFQGIGFAIPTSQAKRIYTILKEKGKVTRGWLGVAIASVDEPQAAEVAKSFGYNSAKGILVQQVFPNTPATGKLKAGDIITKLNGKVMDDAQQLRNAIANIPPQTDVTMEIFRDGKNQDVTIRLGDQPADLMTMGRGGPNAPAEGAPQHNSAATLGFRLADLSPQFAERFGLDANQTGALVTAIDPRSPAAKAGIRPGDVIARVDRQEVTDAEQANAALAKADLKKGVRLYVVSRDISRFVFLQISDHPAPSTK